MDPAGVHRPEAGGHQRQAELFRGRCNGPNVRTAAPGTERPCRYKIRKPCPNSIKGLGLSKLVSKSEFVSMFQRLHKFICLTNLGDVCWGLRTQPGARQIGRPVPRGEGGGP